MPEPTSSPAPVVPFDDTGIPDGRIVRYAGNLLTSAERRQNNNYAAEDILLLVARAYRKGANGQPLVPSDLSPDELKDTALKGNARVAQTRLKELSVQHYLKADPEYKKFLELKARFE